MAYLELSALTKRYGVATAVDDLALSVERGEAVALLGPSGCGKTTTLRMVAGLLAPSEGKIVIDGRDITTLPAYRRNMGYVFQSYALFPHLDVAENIAFGLAERGIAAGERRARVTEALGLIRLSGLERRRPRELSGGQQQRVALARALVIRPDVLLLDESLSNLDAKLREAMRDEIREIQRRLSITTLFVTHDQVEALSLCDRVAVMDRGRIQQLGTPRDIYERPANRFVASFVGRANVLPVERRDGGAVVGGTGIAGADMPPGETDLFIRPQHLRLLSPSEPSGELNRLGGTVVHTVFVGERSEVLVDTAAGRLTLELPAGSSAPPAGTSVAVCWAAADGRFFARERP